MVYSIQSPTVYRSAVRDKFGADELLRLSQEVFSEVIDTLPRPTSGIEASAVFARYYPNLHQLEAWTTLHLRVNS